MPNLAIQPANVPQDIAYPPANAQTLINMVSAYLAISGLENLQGVVVSDTEPAAADRGKLWAKQDVSTLRVLGLFAYSSGRWTAVPVTIPSGEDEPAGAKIGELFYNTKHGALRFFDGAVWTTSWYHTGDTESRPTDVPVGYLYFDEEIGRLLRYTESGYTTHDGAVGDLKMVADISEEVALARNPGWSVFTDLRGRFPLGADPDNDIPSNSTGGKALDEMKLELSSTGHSAQRGNQEQRFVSTLSINGVSVASGAASGAATSKSGEVKLVPPYRTVLFLRKDF